MTLHTKQDKQQYIRLQKILALGRQRYLEAGGDPKRCPSGVQGDDYLTDEERQEALMLGRQIFTRYVEGGYVHRQDNSWQLNDEFSKRSPKVTR